MPDSKGFRVSDQNGFIGTLDASARFLDNRAEKVIRLDGGGELTVRAEELQVQPDGTFLLLRDAERNGTRHLEVPEAASRQSTSETQNGTPAGTDALATFYADDYDIERVAVGRILDAPCEARQEGETFILPVIEEVLVYQKKRLLKEEVRITRRRKQVDEVRKIEQPAELKPGE